MMFKDTIFGMGLCQELHSGVAEGLYALYFTHGIPSPSWNLILRVPE